MYARRWIWLLSALTAAALAACGGSGSSGFDITPAAENLTIEQALAQRECIAETHTLAICPADAGALSTPGAPGSADQVEVDVPLGEANSLSCASANGGAVCTVPLSFTTMGFPPGASFRVATRQVNPDGVWTIAAPPVPSGDAAEAELTTSLDLPVGAGAVQLAILVFVDSGHIPGSSIATLAQSGADFAFVTPPVSVTRP